MKQQHNRSEFTIGLDLGERRHRFCALNGKGEVVEEGILGNERVSLGRLSARYRGALAVMEAGAHSPWISRYLEGLGWEVIVSNPRKVRAGRAPLPDHSARARVWKGCPTRALTKQKKEPPYQ